MQGPSNQSVPGMASTGDQQSISQLGSNSMSLVQQRQLNESRAENERLRAQVWETDDEHLFERIGQEGGGAR